MLKQYAQKHSRHFDRVLAFRPTGWTFPDTAPDEESNNSYLSVEQVSGDRRVLVLGIPYSEHSSFDELQSFVQSLRPSRLIPTVFSSRSGGSNRESLQSILNAWLKD
jgi:DNA cross-link repair 1A protein